MSRFDFEGDPAEYPNADDLWWSTIGRALNGTRGQQALAELEQALLDLPAPRLISGHIALGNEVCAVGALVTRRRLANGEKLEAILADLEGRVPPTCECSHPKSEHKDGTGHCVSVTFGGRSCWDNCQTFRIADGYSEACGDDETAAAGVEVGLTYSLAWRLAYLNDEELDGETPESRYEKVLAWVRDAQIARAAA